MRLDLLFTAILILANVESSHLPDSLSRRFSHLKPRAWRRRKAPKVEFGFAEYPKYFHEPDGNEALHHYDSRYHHEVLGFDEKTNTQIHLMRSYLEFFKINHMETWLAHGTLLGWWWNAKLLPWDWDIDTQVSIATMAYLAENYNTTKYTYTSKTDTEFDPATSKQKSISRKYHLDVNPALYTRHRNQGANIIDARWIDIRNGLYIDITAVAETHPEGSPGVWTCKNYHRYKTHDLWPMRETIFEGVPAKVPYSYNDVLSREYGEKSLAMDEFRDHKWSLMDRVWVRKTPSEIEHQDEDARAARRRKQEEKAERLKEENEREKGMLFSKEGEEKERAKKEEEDRLRGVSPVEEPEDTPGKASAKRRGKRRLKKKPA